MDDIGKLLDELAGSDGASFTLDDIAQQGTTKRRRLVARSAGGFVAVAALVVGGFALRSQPADITVDIAAPPIETAAPPIETAAPAAAPQIATAEPVAPPVATQTVAEPASATLDPASASDPEDSDLQDGVQGNDAVATPAASVTEASPSPPPTTAVPSAPTAPPAATPVPQNAETPPPVNRDATPTPTLPAPTATAAALPTPTATAVPVPSATPTTVATAIATPTAVPDTRVKHPECTASLVGSAPFASSTFGAAYPQANAFDQDATTSWISQTWQSPAIVGQSIAASAGTVTAYQIRYNNGPRLVTRAPQSWTFEGQGSDGSWTVLDTQTGHTGWGERKDRSFDLADDVASYVAYRLVVTADNDDRAPIVVVSIAELGLFADCRFDQ